MIVIRILDYSTFHWMHLIWIDTYSCCWIISRQPYLLFFSNFQANPIFVCDALSASHFQRLHRIEIWQREKNEEIDSIKYRLPLAILYRFFFLPLTYHNCDKISKIFECSQFAQAIFHINCITFAIGLIHL